MRKLIGLGVLLFMAACAQGPQQQKQDVYGSPQGAYDISKSFVTKSLKAPSTAKFPLFSDEDVIISSLSYGEYKISAWVDAQNSFGAMLRTPYKCSVQYVGKNEWVLKDIKLGDQ